jgi:hypothetical protein
LALTLTADQVAALAPDASALKAARGLAAPRPWSNLGADEQAAWGECQGSGSRPYQVRIDLGGPFFGCSCPSRKLPCKHGLGLLLLLQNQPDRFEPAPYPAWVAEWLTARAQRAEKKAVAPAVARRAPSADTANQAAREAKIAVGLDELERWLHDLVRRGLASLQAEPPRFWDAVAARLVDAQAPGLARLVRELSGLPASGEGWPERLLERLGCLALLLQAYRRQDSLSVPLRETVRALVGWTQNQDELLGGPGLRDQWLALGQRVERDDQLRVQRTWLYGQNSGEWVLVLAFAHGTQPLDTGLLPGAAFDAELVFFPGLAPRRALVKQRHAPIELIGTPPGTTVAEARSAYAAALAANPWLDRFPLALAAVVPHRSRGSWAVRDDDNQALPLNPRFDRTWELLAISGGQSVALFGEWDGDQLLPLAVWSEGRCTAFANGPV